MTEIAIFQNLAENSKLLAVFNCSTPTFTKSLECMGKYALSNLFFSLLLIFSARKYKNDASGFDYKSMWTLRELFAEAILVVTALYNPQSDENWIKLRLHSIPLRN